MLVAYLVNKYPAASHSFIRREIRAVEAQGTDIVRFTVRYPKLMELPDPRDREELAKTTALLHHGAIRLLFAVAGWASSDAVVAHLREARAMVLPSFAEGLPVVIMEALALGRPVITTSIAGIPELVDGACGWLVPAGSIEELAQAMAEAPAATPGRLSEMGQVGRQRVLQLHDASLNGAELNNLFRTAYGNRD